MPVTTVSSRWESGSLIFHEKDNYGSIANIMTIAPGAVTIGSATQDTDFKVFLGSVSKYLLCDVGNSLVTFAGVDVAISGDLTVTVEDISVDQGHFIYLDGQSGGEYVVSDTAGDLMLNATTNLNLAIGGTDEVRLTATVFSPATSDGSALGSTSLMWGDLFLASLGIINFNAGDVTITHAANLLTVAGGNLRMGTTDRIEFRDATEYLYSSTDGQVDIVAATTVAISGAVTADSSITATGAILPTVSGTPALGSATLMWSDLFLADTAVINFNNGNVTITHSAGLLSMVGGDLTIGAAGTLINDVIFYGESTARFLWNSSTPGVTLTEAPVASTITGTGIGFTATMNASTAVTGWALGFFGSTTGSMTSGNSGNLAGGCFEVNLASGYAATQNGMIVGTYIGAYSSQAGRQPTAGLFIETIPGSGVSFAATGAATDMPMIALVTSGAGTKSSLAIEFGSEAAGKTISSGTTGNMEYHQTIQVKVNGTLMYWPLSTAEGTYTTAYPIVSTSVLGYSNTAALDPDSTRSNHAFAYGWRGDANEVTATMEAAATQHLEPIAVNLDIAGANPSGTSTVNVFYQNLTHDTTDMAALRLKQADWYISVKKDVLDVYNMQLETGFGAASITVGGEMAVLGLVLDGGTDEVSCNAWRGLNVTLRGSGSPACAQGIFVNAESALVVDNGINLVGSGMQSAIRVGTTSYANSPVNFVGFPAAGTTPVSTFSGTAHGGTKVKIACLIGNQTYYMLASTVPA